MMSYVSAPSIPYLFIRPFLRVTLPQGENLETSLSPNIFRVRLIKYFISNEIEFHPEIMSGVHSCQCLMNLAKRVASSSHFTYSTSSLVLL